MITTVYLMGKAYKFATCDLLLIPNIAHMLIKTDAERLSDRWQRGSAAPDEDALFLTMDRPTFSKIMDFVCNKHVKYPVNDVARIIALGINPSARCLIFNHFDTYNYPIHLTTPILSYLSHQSWRSLQQKPWKIQLIPNSPYNDLFINILGKMLLVCVDENFKDFHMQLPNSNNEQYIYIKNEIGDTITPAPRFDLWLEYWGIIYDLIIEINKFVEILQIKV